MRLERPRAASQIRHSFEYSITSDEKPARPQRNGSIPAHRVNISCFQSTSAPHPATIPVRTPTPQKSLRRAVPTVRPYPKQLSQISKLAVPAPLKLAVFITSVTSVLNAEMRSYFSLPSAAEIAFKCLSTPSREKPSASSLALTSSSSCGRLSEPFSFVTRSTTNCTCSLDGSGFLTRSLLPAGFPIGP